MRNTLSRMSGVVLLLAASGMPLAAQTTAHLTVPVTGSNNFKGTATINRFVNQGSQISAIGVVKNSAGTAFAAVSWQVTLTASSGALTGTSGHAPTTPQFTQIAWPQRGRNRARLVPVQGTGSCGALNISLGATTINLAGSSVTLNPINLDISGQSGTPVGGLVCSILNIVGSAGGLVNSVGNVVNLLNSLLGSLTGALGGVTGGLGGVTGGATGGA
jgi:hypothetical protein